MKRVSLNIDLGELPDESDEWYSIATMANIACGGHAGDSQSMRRAIDLATDKGVKIVAHPSYPDRENFGRKSMRLNMIRLAWHLHAQLLQLMTIANLMGGSVFAVKPHGALYHDAVESGLTGEILLTVMETLVEHTWAIVGPPQGKLRDNAIARGMPYLNEGFADRTYLPDGLLVPRSEPNALITDPEEAASQAVRLARTQSFDTLCVHSDTPNALAVARAVRKALMDAELLDGV